MKKFLLTLCLCLGFTHLASFEVKAKEEHSTLNQTETTTYIESTFDDGSYIEVTIEEDISLSRATNTKTGSKTKTYKDSSGTQMWSIKVTGSFSYDGITSTCTSSTYTKGLNTNSTWKLSNAKSWKSGSTAYASVTAQNYTMLGVLVSTITETVSLTCSATGVLS